MSPIYLPWEVGGSQRTGNRVSTNFGANPEQPERGEMAACQDTRGKKQNLFCGVEELAVRRGRRRGFSSGAAAAAFGAKEKQQKKKRKNRQKMSLFRRVTRLINSWVLLLEARLKTNGYFVRRLLLAKPLTMIAPSHYYRLDLRDASTWNEVPPTSGNPCEKLLRAV